MRSKDEIKKTPISDLTGMEWHEINLNKVREVDSELFKLVKVIQTNAELILEARKNQPERFDIIDVTIQFNATLIDLFKRFLLPIISKFYYYRSEGFEKLIDTLFQEPFLKFADFNLVDSFLDDIIKHIQETVKLNENRLLTQEIKAEIVEAKQKPPTVFDFANFETKDLVIVEKSLIKIANKELKSLISFFEKAKEDIHIYYSPKCLSANLNLDEIYLANLHKALIEKEIVSKDSKALFIDIFQCKEIEKSRGRVRFIKLTNGAILLNTLFSSHSNKRTPWKELGQFFEGELSKALNQSKKTSHTYDLIKGEIDSLL